MIYHSRCSIPRSNLAAMMEELNRTVWEAQISILSCNAFLFTKSVFLAFDAPSHSSNTFPGFINQL